MLNKIIIFSISLWCFGMYGMEKLENGSYPSTHLYARSMPRSLPPDTQDRIIIHNPYLYQDETRNITTPDLRVAVLKKQHNAKITRFGPFFRRIIKDMLFTRKEKIILQRPSKQATSYFSRIVMYGIRLLSDRRPYGDENYRLELMNEITD